MTNRRWNHGSSGRFYFLEFQNHWNSEIKRCLLLGRKAMINLDCIKKQRHHFVDKNPYSQNYGFSSSHVQIWELDCKKRLNVKEFMQLNCGAGEESWEWVPWIARSNQSILREINPEYSLEALKLKLKYFDVKSQLTGKDPDVDILKAKLEGGDRGWHDWIVYGHELEQN